MGAVAYLFYCVLNRHSSVRFEQTLNYELFEEKQDFEELKGNLETAFTEKNLGHVFEIIAGVRQIIY